MKDAIFFERDGVLNLCEVREGHQVVPLRPDEFRLNPAAHEWLPALRDAGFVLIVTSNQPAVSQGRLTRRDLDLMHWRLRRQLPINDIFVCPYDDPSHPCYKPQPGMLLEAAFKWSIDLDHSFVISDKWADAKAAQVAGCTSVLIESPWRGRDHHDFVVADLGAAVRKVLALRAPSSAERSLVGA